MQDEGGTVTGASLKLGWEAGTRSTVQLSRSLSQFGALQHETAGECMAPAAAAQGCRFASGLCCKGC
jgi:hypothetical protein